MSIPMDLHGFKSLENLCKQAREDPDYYQRDIAPVLHESGFLSKYVRDPNFGKSLTLASMASTEKPPADYFKRVDTDNDIAEFLFLRGLGDNPGSLYVPVPSESVKEFEKAISGNDVQFSKAAGMLTGIFLDLGILTLIQHYFGDQLNKIDGADPMAPLYAAIGTALITIPVIAGVHIAPKFAKKRRDKRINAQLQLYSDQIIKDDKQFSYKVIKQVL